MEGRENMRELSSGGFDFCYAVHSATTPDSWGFTCISTYLHLLNGVVLAGMFLYVAGRRHSTTALRAQRCRCSFPRSASCSPISITHH